MELMNQKFGGDNAMNISADLTKREEQIGSLIAWGAIKKEVADRLCISVHTVENHVRNIFDKTDCHNSSEFSAWYFCKHFGISVELSPLKNVIATILLMIFLSGEVMQTVSDIARYGERTSRTETRCKRLREELDDDDIKL